MVQQTPGDGALAPAHQEEARIIRQLGGVDGPVVRDQSIPGLGQNRRDLGQFVLTAHGLQQEAAGGDANPQTTLEIGPGIRGWTFDEHDLRIFPGEGGDDLLLHQAVEGIKHPIHGHLQAFHQSLDQDIRTFIRADSVQHRSQTVAAEDPGPQKAPGYQSHARSAVRDDLALMEAQSTHLPIGIDDQLTRPPLAGDGLDEALEIQDRSQTVAFGGHRRGLTYGPECP